MSPSTVSPTPTPPRAGQAATRALVGLILISAALCRADRDDSTDVNDPPGLPRFSGYVISGGVSRESGSHDFSDGQGGTTTRDGAEWEINYSLKDGAKVPSPLEVFRHFESAFKKKGGTTLFKKLDASGGEGVLKVPLGGGADRWLHIVINNDAQQLIFHVIDDRRFAPRSELTAAEMAHALERDGRFTLRGVLFEDGKDTLKHESDPVLAELTSLLVGDDALKLSIEAHTDDVGGKANVALSKRRAESVRKYLVGRGIEGARLKTAGYGATRPASPDLTEEGRAQNRRIELIRQ